MRSTSLYHCYTTDGREMNVIGKNITKHELCNGDLCNTHNSSEPQYQNTLISDSTSDIKIFRTLCDLQKSFGCNLNQTNDNCPSDLNNRMDDFRIKCIKSRDTNNEYCLETTKTNCSHLMNVEQNLQWKFFQMQAFSGNHERINNNLFSSFIHTIIPLLFVRLFVLV